MQKTIIKDPPFEHKLQCDAHRSRIEFYCSEPYCELRFLCFNCVNLPGYHQHDNKKVASINQLLSNSVDDSVLVNENNFFGKCVELRSIVNSMPETVATILDLSKKILARLRARKQTEMEDISPDSKRQKLHLVNNDIIQQIKSHTHGRSLESVKSIVRESIALKKDLEKDSLWAIAVNAQEGYDHVNHFMSISHQKLKDLSDYLESFFFLLEKPAPGSVAKDSGDKSPAMAEESKQIGKALPNGSKPKNAKRRSSR